MDGYDRICKAHSLEASIDMILIVISAIIIGVGLWVMDPV